MPRGGRGRFLSAFGYHAHLVPLIYPGELDEPGVKGFLLLLFLSVVSFRYFLFSLSLSLSPSLFVLLPSTSSTIFRSHHHLPHHSVPSRIPKLLRARGSTSTIPYRGGFKSSRSSSCLHSAREQACPRDPRRDRRPPLRRNARTSRRAACDNVRLPQDTETSNRSRRTDPLSLEEGRSGEQGRAWNRSKSDDGASKKSTRRVCGIGARTVRYRLAAIRAAPETEMKGELCCGNTGNSAQTLAQTGDSKGRDSARLNVERPKRHRGRGDNGSRDTLCRGTEESRNRGIE